MKKQMNIIIILLVLSIVTLTNAQTDNLAGRGNRFSEWSAPVNLGPPVNSSADDLSAVILKDGLTLYFSSNRNGSGREDIWFSKRRNKNSPWQEPVNLGAVVNSASMDRLRSISSDGRILLFQSDRTVGSQGGSDIWVTTRSRSNDDFGWRPPVNLGAIINTNKEEIAANYLFGKSGRNHQLFFSSSRLGGKNNSADIYLSEIPLGGSFGQPVNISELNSDYTESCFWVSDDGLEIIFSSTRAALNFDLNSFDLWVSTRTSVFDNWSPPVSLGLTINTANYREVNPNLSADGQTMYFTSNRPNGGLGGNDIYLTTRRRLRGNE